MLQSMLHAPSLLPLLFAFRKIFLPCIGLEGVQWAGARKRCFSAGLGGQ